MTTHLSYPSFHLQGGDWGAGIVRTMAVMFPDDIESLHLNFIFAKPFHPNANIITQSVSMQMLAYLLSSFSSSPTSSSSTFSSTCRWLLGMEEADVQALLVTQNFLKEGSGYYAIQSTRPYTLGVGLNDSPLGLLAWIGEKMRGNFSKDEILTNVCIYWFSQSITTSFRLYKEGGNFRDLFDPFVKAPTAVAIFPNEVTRPPRKWVEWYCNLTRFTRMKSGGHFAALEAPEEWLEDVRAHIADVIVKQKNSKI